MRQDDGRVPSEPGCEASPSAASGVFAESHPSRVAIDRALAQMFAFGDSRLFGKQDLASSQAWGLLKRSAARAVIDGLHDAGFAVVQMGADFPTEMTEEEGPSPYQRTVRLRMEVKPSIIGCNQIIDHMRWEDDRYRLQYMPRSIAREMLSHVERDVAERIVASLTRDTDRSGEAGQTAEQAGPKARARSRRETPNPEPSEHP